MIRTILAAIVLCSLSVFNTAQAACKASCLFSKCEFSGTGGNCSCNIGFSRCQATTTKMIAQPNFGDPNVIDQLVQFQEAVARLGNENSSGLALTLSEMVGVYRAMDYPRYLSLAPKLEHQFDALPRAVSAEVQSIADRLSEEKGCGGESTAKWTPWLNRDRPSGKGDYETLLAHMAENGVCSAPSNIECREVGQTGLPTGQNITCNMTEGMYCVNDGQYCKDYEVRFLCQ